ncbi:VIPR1 [Cordylochernes scorpioides]|uniref:VIPR1 n=1 Tax=Cordylochernes scorpioides TaxID=51811 RepID=A0ABY6K4N3_9ARAC|nr:VIPR1 [Cordylochernes scorpioides]
MRGGYVTSGRGGFFLDNLSVVKSVLNSKTGNYLIDRALLLISRLNRNGNRCTIQWFKGHSGKDAVDIPPILWPCVQMSEKCALQYQDLHNSGAVGCNASWDSFYCWPFTPAGETVVRECSIIFAPEGIDPDNFQGLNKCAKFKISRNTLSANLNFGFGYRALRTLYLQVVVPAIAYASAVWFPNLSQRSLNVLLSAQRPFLAEALGLVKALENATTLPNHPTLGFFLDNLSVVKSGLNSKTGAVGCNASWDSFYCWPFTPAGETVVRECSVIFAPEGIDPDNFQDAMSGGKGSLDLAAGGVSQGWWNRGKQRSSAREQ